MRSRGGAKSRRITTTTSELLLLHLKYFAPEYYLTSPFFQNQCWSVLGTTKLDHPDRIFNSCNGRTWKQKKQEGRMEGRVILSFRNSNVKISNRVQTGDAALGHASRWRCRDSLIIPRAAKEFDGVIVAVCMCLASPYRKPRLRPCVYARRGCWSPPPHSA